MEIIIKNKPQPRVTCLAPGAHKRGIYPFVTENINGSPMVVKSHEHRKQLMKEYNLHDDRVSPELASKRRRWFREEQREKKRDFVTETFMKAKYGKIDTRPTMERIKKAEYEKRNGKNMNYEMKYEK